MLKLITSLKEHKSIYLFTFFTVIAILIILLAYSLNLDWLGFNAYTSPSVPLTRQFQRAKTLWDWLQLVIIPSGIALSLYLFNRSERNAEKDSTLDNQRATILQTYIDQMSTMLLETNLSESQPDNKVLIIARTRTLIALSKLDPVRKANLFEFLYEAGLLGKFPLINADLSGTDIRGFNFGKWQMQKVDLSKANLSGATFYETNLTCANLKGANLDRADFNHVDLAGADLTEANMTEVVLFKTNLGGAIYTEKQLKMVRYQKGDFYAEY